MNEKKSPNWPFRISLVFVLLLFCSNLLLLRYYLEHTHDKKSLEAQNVEQEMQILDLEVNHNKSLNQLSELRGENEELNQKIEAQKLLITDQKDKIIKMIRAGRDTAAINKEVRKMTALSKVYIEQINQLKAENEKILASNQQIKAENTKIYNENTRLKQEKNAVVQEAEIHKEEIAKLSTEKAQAEEKSKNLENELIYKELNIKNLKVRLIQNTEKNKETVKAKKIEKITMCFDVIPNKDNTLRAEVFQIRIVHETSKALFKDASHGIIRLPDNSVMESSADHKIEYKGDPINTCLSLKLDDKMAKGTYNVYIFNKNKLVDETNFSLK
ncbi:hypothetical protein [Haliscomenobacter sp.]|uniref:hypothetical protein n=1 Tax=Haliscomenobacter sp. TaxID=2717303 RepID=UPI003BA8778D